MLLKLFQIIRIIDREESNSKFQTLIARDSCFIVVVSIKLYRLWLDFLYLMFQAVFTYSKSTVETPEQCEICSNLRHQNNVSDFEQIFNFE